MYRIKIRLLEAFRAFREDENDMALTDLNDMIKGVKAQVPVMTIDQLIHLFFTTGQCRNEAFTLYQDEVIQLQHIRNKIFETSWINNIPVLHKLDTDIAAVDHIPLILGGIGAELRVGMEFSNTVPDREVSSINLYDSNLRWKYFCEAFGLLEFKLYVINYSDYRPYKFELAQYNFYPYPEILSELKSECRIFIDYCKANNLEKYILSHYLKD
jgi:hypothetical protein